MNGALSCHVRDRGVHNVRAAKATKRARLTLKGPLPPTTSEPVGEGLMRLFGGYVWMRNRAAGPSILRHAPSPEPPTPVGGRPYSDMDFLRAVSQVDPALSGAHWVPCSTQDPGTTHPQKQAFMVLRGTFKGCEDTLFVEAGAGGNYLYSCRRGAALEYRRGINELARSPKWAFRMALP